MAPAPPTALLSLPGHSLGASCGGGGEWRVASLAPSQLALLAKIFRSKNSRLRRRAGDRPSRFVLIHQFLVCPRHGCVVAHTADTG